MTDPFLDTSILDAIRMLNTFQISWNAEAELFARHVVPTVIIDFEYLIY